MRFRSLSVYLAAILFTTSVSWPAEAQLASRPADDWVKVLESPNRIQGLKVDEIIAKLRFKSGDVIADLGAGPGLFSLPFAKAVSPSGKVYAVEVDQGFLDMIARKTDAQGIKNVQPVLGKFTDPSLPSTDVDVAFFHDVLHHIEDRAGYLKNVARYVKPGGRVVIIDFPADKSPHKDDPKLIVSKDQTTAWMAAAGFKPVEEVTDVFSDKWFVVYTR